MPVVVGLRSTSNYYGDLLRQAEYYVDGTNLYHRDKKELGAFEQKLVEYYGAIPYYNPKKDAIEIIGFRRYKKIPEKVLRFKDDEDPKKRKCFHISESRRESIRSIQIKETIKRYYTIDSYIKNKRKLGRVVPYVNTIRQMVIFE